MEHDIILGRRRLRCLSPTLLRLQFAPDGAHEDRLSLAAAQPQTALPWQEQLTEDGWTVLRTGALELRLRDHEAPFDRLNTEIRWSDGRLCQFWRPGDRDYRNLGGTLRSLDRYGGDGAALDGVHVAGMDSPDPSGTSWPAWIQCEVDPLYADLHAAPPPGFNKGNWLRAAREPQAEHAYLERTFNWYADARRFCPGILSRAGYFLLNDTDGAALDADGFPVERRSPGAQDWYFFGYGSHYRQALKDFRDLSGPAPIPPARSLGIMFSRWPAFTRAESEDLVAKFRDLGAPLATLIMDMEWHTEGWGAWDVNTALIPDLAEFADWAHSQGLHLVFNDHPLDLRDDDSHFHAYVEAAPDAHVRPITYNGKTLHAARIDITDKTQTRAFQDICHRPLTEAGLDYWWNDGSRGQMRQTCGQLVANKLFYEEVDRPEARGMLLARYGGIGSQRYGAFFTGDTQVDWQTLRLECEFNIRAGNLGLSWISHDIGGFFTKGKVETIDPELYARWLQFGCFNPILRFHSAPGSGSRAPWDYADWGDWLRIRHALLPYLYSAAGDSYVSGLPLTRGHFLDLPRDPDAYRYDQYMFGDDLLVAPVMDPGGEREVWLPPGDHWYAFDGHECLPGGVSIRRRWGQHELPIFVRAGAIIPMQDPDTPELHVGARPALSLYVYPAVEEDGSRVAGCQLYEDDGLTNAYQTGAYSLTSFGYEAEPDGSAHLVMETVQGQPLVARRSIAVHLPDGLAAEFLDLPTATPFEGEIE